jgi:LacI family transcriptional regulator
MAEQIRRVTLNDVARASGFHRATVGQVLNDAPCCWASAATRAKIRDAARTLGYRPNLMARALRSGQSRVIGLIAPGFGIGSPHNRAAGLTEAAARHDFLVAVTSHPNDAESEDRAIRRLLDRGVDGLAIYPVDSGPHVELRRLVARIFPVVTFHGAHLLDFPCDDVSVDCAEVGRLQARHLLDLCRRRICIANTLPPSRITTIREEGIRRELARVGAPAPLSMDLPGDIARELVGAASLTERMQAFLTRHRGAFDAVIGGDPTAALAIRLLHAMDLRVPEDVAVVGGGDSILTDYGEVPLTSVNAPNDAVGAKAFELLLERIEGHAGAEFRRLMLPTPLQVRASTVHGVTH